MKKTILMISNLGFSASFLHMQKRILAFCCLGLALNANAQLLEFPDIYPPLPFNLLSAKEQANNKCIVWKGVYSKAADDDSGFIWSDAITESHQFQKYIFPDGKMNIISNYNEFGNKLWTIEFFYKQGFLTPYCTAFSLNIYEIIIGLSFYNIMKKYIHIQLKR